MALTYSIRLFTQADISMSTHWYNRANYNPASIVRPGYIYLFSNARRQWVDIAGSPTTLNVQASGLNYNYHSAWGVSLVSDQTGVSQVINPMLSYAYRIGKSENSWLSLGISAGVFARFTDVSKYEAADQTDQTLYSNSENTTAPDVNFGAEYQSPYLIFGLSSTHLLAIGKTMDTYLNANHIYGYAIYKNSFSENINYNIGSHAVYRNGLLVFQGNVLLRFKLPTGLLQGSRELFDLGITYSTSKQLIFLFGLNITNNFRIGYAYDQSFTVGYNTSPTHEIILEYRIPSKKASACHCHDEGLWYY